MRLEAGINGLPGFTAVVGCSYSPGLRRCIVSDSSESTFDAFYIEATPPSLITNAQFSPSSVDLIIPLLAGRQQYTI